MSDLAPKKCDDSCRFWTFDMDGAYCLHKKSFEIAPVFGASTNRMSMEGHCTLADHQLWEASSGRM